jgi:hypothetical protein
LEYIRQGEEENAWKKERREKKSRKIQLKCLEDAENDL